MATVVCKVSNCNHNENGFCGKSHVMLNENGICTETAEMMARMFMVMPPFGFNPESIQKEAQCH